MAGAGAHPEPVKGAVSRPDRGFTQLAALIAVLLSAASLLAVAFKLNDAGGNTVPVVGEGGHMYGSGHMYGNGQMYGSGHMYGRAPTTGGADPSARSRRERR